MSVPRMGFGLSCKQYLCWEERASSDQMGRAQSPHLKMDLWLHVNLASPLIYIYIYLFIYLFICVDIEFFLVSDSIGNHAQSSETFSSTMERFSLDASESLPWTDTKKEKRKKVEPGEKTRLISWLELIFGVNKLDFSFLSSAHFCFAIFISYIGSVEWTQCTSHLTHHKNKIWNKRT